jgi:hypothetical protein
MSVLDARLEGCDREFSPVLRAPASPVELDRMCLCAPLPQTVRCVLPTGLSWRRQRVRIVSALPLPGALGALPSLLAGAFLGDACDVAEREPSAALRNVFDRFCAAAVETNASSTRCGTATATAVPPPRVATLQREAVQIVAGLLTQYAPANDVPTWFMDGRWAAAVSSVDVVEALVSDDRETSDDRTHHRTAPTISLADVAEVLRGIAGLHDTSGAASFDLPSTVLEHGIVFDSDARAVACDVVDALRALGLAAPAVVIDSTGCGALVNVAQAVRHQCARQRFGSPAAEAARGDASLSFHATFILRATALCGRVFPVPAAPSSPLDRGYALYVAARIESVPISATMPVFALIVDAGRVFRFGSAEVTATALGVDGRWRDMAHTTNMDLKLLQ